MKKISKILLAIWAVLYMLFSFWGIGGFVPRFNWENLLGRFNVIPFSFVGDFLKNLSYGGEMNFFNLFRYFSDFFFNIIIFIPFGLLFGKSFKKTIFWGVLLVVGVELLQLAFALFGIGNRVCDINDFISAFIGIAVGYFLKDYKN